MSVPQIDPTVPSAAVSYREYTLGAPLDCFVECVWFAAQRGLSAPVQRIPPDGCMEAILHLGASFGQVENGRVVEQPSQFLVGVWTGPIALAAPATYETIGIRFRPGCAQLFVAAPASAFTNRVVDLHHVWGAGAASLGQELGDTRSDSARVSVVRRFLLARLQPNDPLVGRSIARILETRGRVTIDALAQRSGASHRHIERAFLTIVGVPAKTLCRIVRFQNVLRHVAHGSEAEPKNAAAWADIAVACGYADQSHLIRDFSQLAGETPRQLVAASDALAAYFRTASRLRRLFRATELSSHA